MRDAAEDERGPVRLARLLVLLHEQAAEDHHRVHAEDGGEAAISVMPTSEEISTIMTTS